MYIYIYIYIHIYIYIYIARERYHVQDLGSSDVSKRRCLTKRTAIFVLKIPGSRFRTGVLKIPGLEPGSFVALRFSDLCMLAPDWARSELTLLSIDTDI